MSLKMGSLNIRSSVFENENSMPTKYTGDGENISPPLEWSGVPEGTKELVIICHDPDAPLPRGFDHWVVYGISPNTTSLKEGAGKDGKSESLTHGKNGMGKEGYIGPAPPANHGPHHYYFWIYALDSPLKLKSGLSSNELLTQISPHVKMQARTVGKYQK